ncbi:hypothetical protein [Streptosporangium sp. KLBMP 9127]|nr:hypothetical protein [Streptosporangium sp. KLBMP 9127]
MSPKRGDSATPPPLEEEWEIRFDSTEVARGWTELYRQAPANLRVCYDILRLNPAPAGETSRHHLLRREHARRSTSYYDFDQWQYEVTSGGRVWYVVEEKTRTVWITYASPAHPKETE